MIRDGLEDYECFTILERHLDEKPGALPKRKLKRFRERLPPPKSRPT